MQLIANCHAKLKSLIPCTLNGETTVQSRDQCLQLWPPKTCLSPLHAQLWISCTTKPRARNHAQSFHNTYCEHKKIHILTLNTRQYCSSGCAIGRHFQAESTPSCSANIHAVSSCTNLRHRRGLIFSLHTYRGHYNESVMQTTCVE